MWKVEIIQRAGNKILIFYAGDKEEAAQYGNSDPFNNPALQVRGQIEVQSGIEFEKWQNLIKHLND